MQAAVEVTREKAPSIKEKRLIEELRSSTISYYLVKEADLTVFSIGELREIFTRSVHNGKLTPDVLLDAASHEEALNEDTLALCRLASWTKKELKSRGVRISLNSPGQHISLEDNVQPFPGNPSYKDEISRNPVKIEPCLGRTA